MKLRVIDLETTGFAPASASIIEIAFVDLDASLKETERFSTFVRPPRGVDELLASPGARAVHHIAPADIEHAPSLAQALATIEAEHGRPDILAAHNAKFERQWLAEIWPAASWLCSMKSAMRAWQNADSYSLSFLRYWLALQKPLADVPAHRALADVLVTADLLRRLVEFFSPSEMTAHEGEPARLPSVPFGKHRGARWRDVPAGYLSWIIDKMDGDESRADIVACARHELTARRA